MPREDVTATAADERFQFGGYECRACDDANYNAVVQSDVSRSLHGFRIPAVGKSKYGRIRWHQIEQPTRARVSPVPSWPTTARIKRSRAQRTR